MSREYGYDYFQDKPKCPSCKWDLSQFNANAHSWLGERVEGSLEGLVNGRWICTNPNCELCGNKGHGTLEKMPDVEAYWNRHNEKMGVKIVPIPEEAFPVLKTFFEDNGMMGEVIRNVFGGVKVDPTKRIEIAFTKTDGTVERSEVTIAVEDSKESE